MKAEPCMPLGLRFKAHMHGWCEVEQAATSHAVLTLLRLVAERWLVHDTCRHAAGMLTYREVTLQDRQWSVCPTVCGADDRFETAPLPAVIGERSTACLLNLQRTTHAFA